MNIGIVTTWFERGASYVSRQYVKSLKKDHEIFIYVRGGESRAYGNREWDDGESVTWGRDISELGFQWIDLIDFERWLKNCQIEVVLFNEQAWWPPILLCNELGIKTAAYIDYYTEETIPFFGVYDLLLCNTKRHYSAFEWHPQCFYLPWGTEISLFKPETYQAVERGVITFFHSCGMNPRRKGTDLLLKAYAKVGDRSRLVIHSQVKLASFFPELRGIIEKLKATGRLICYEQTVTAPGLYHLGDVYVYPSRLDGIGLTIAEALACGLPVITGDAAPMNEFIHEQTGALAKIARWYARQDGYYWPQCNVDIDSLGSCMNSYLISTDELSDRKKSARAYAEKHLNWETNSNELPDIFSQLRKPPSTETSDLVERIKEYEQRRASLKGKLYLTAPSVARVLLKARGLTRTIRRTALAEARS